MDMKKKNDQSATAQLNKANDFTVFDLKFINRINKQQVPQRMAIIKEVIIKYGIVLLYWKCNSYFCSVG